MKMRKQAFALLLALLLTGGMTACGKPAEPSGSSMAESSAAEDSTEESAAVTTAVRGRMTVDGRYLSEEGIIELPYEITVSGVKAAVGRILYEGEPRLQAVTEAIDGTVYTILERGTVPAAWIKAELERENAYMIGISGYATVGELHEDGTADYVINVSSDQCIRLAVTPDKTETKEFKQKYKKDYEGVRTFYDSLVEDFISEAVINANGC